MTMTDPIADMLARLRNANSAYHEDVAMPHSKIKANIAEILKSEGYIAGYDVADAEVGKTLTLQLKYGPSRERSIAGLRRVSKPGLRVYAKSTSLPRVPVWCDLPYKPFAFLLHFPSSVLLQEDEPMSR